MATTSATGVKYDPVTTATSLATSYTAGQQTLLTAQTKTAADTVSALASLKSAMSGFQSSLSALTTRKSFLTQAATFSNSAIGSASATANASAGSYSFFVEKLAAASQVSYAGLSATPAAGAGSLDITQAGGASFSVALSGADADGDGNLTPKEIAVAINKAPNNLSKVTASIVTIGGVSQLVLSAAETGAAGKLTLDATNVANATLKSALTDPGNYKEVVQAQDAVVWLGAQTSGTKIEQASNTFTVIDDVKLSFTKAMAPGDTPVTVTVATDTATTNANVQAFVDGYNKLKVVLDGLTAAGNPGKKVAAGAFAHDSGVGVLASRMLSTIRQSVGGLTLANFGITAQRDGTLALDTAKLSAALTRNPDGLDKIMGSSALGAQTGVAGALDKYLALWSNSTNGQITQRQTSVTKQQTALETRQTALDSQYNSAYQRYLVQFTQLQNLQSQMASNTSLFDAMFSGTA